MKEKLEKEASELESKISELKSTLSDKKLEIMKIDYPFEVGQRLINKNGTIVLFAGFFKGRYGWETYIKKIKKNGDPFQNKTWEYSMNQWSAVND